MNTKLAIFRYGELALKKRNRDLFERQLQANLCGRLHGLGIRSNRRLPGRILIEFDGPASWESVEERTRNVFGFSSASLVYRTDPSMEDLESKIVAEASRLKFDSFAVRAKRSNKKFPLTSPEICSRLGAVIKEKTGARVDLEGPEKIFRIEVLDRDIFFSHEEARGPGGLPVGTGGRVLALLSGGIDSPVASWMMMKRGLTVNFVHFHSTPFTDGASIEKVEDIAEELARWQGESRLALVPFGELQKKIVTAVPSRYRVILYRRFMIDIASRVADQIGASALVTGEALGQVASQTLSNIATVEARSKVPVLRPLIGMDKQEIVDRARSIGTFDLSIEPHQDCCSFLMPPNPVIRTTCAELDGVEAELDIEGLVGETLKNIAWREIDGRKVS